MTGNETVSSRPVRVGGYFGAGTLGAYGREVDGSTLLWVRALALNPGIGETSTEYRTRAAGCSEGRTGA